MFDTCIRQWTGRRKVALPADFGGFLLLDVSAYGPNAVVSGVFGDQYTEDYGQSFCKLVQEEKNGLTVSGSQFVLTICPQHHPMVVGLRSVFGKTMRRMNLLYARSAHMLMFFFPAT